MADIFGNCFISKVDAVASITCRNDFSNIFTGSGQHSEVSVIPLSVLHFTIEAVYIWEHAVRCPTLKCIYHTRKEVVFQDKASLKPDWSDIHFL